MWSRKMPPLQAAHMDKYKAARRLPQKGCDHIENIIKLYYTEMDTRTKDLIQLLDSKCISYDAIWTPDLDTPYIVLCGLDPLPYEHAVCFLHEQTLGRELHLGERSLSALGFVTSFPSPP